MKPVDLSIVIPTFRREREVVEAVRSALAVPRLAIEVLVVDDSPEGSAEQALAVIDDERLIYRKRREPTGGCPARVRNEAAFETKGRVLYFLDDDDRAIPELLADAAERLLATDAGVLISAPRPFGDDPAQVEAERRYFERSLAMLDQPRSKWTLVSRLLFRDTFLVCSSCLVTRAAFDAVGGFDPEIPLCEDVEFYLRAIRHAGYARASGPILERRIGQPSLMNQADHAAKVASSYALFHDKYRRRHGRLELLALRLLSYVA